MIIKYKNIIKIKIDKVIDESKNNNKKIESIELDKSEFISFINDILSINLDYIPCDVNFLYRDILITYKNKCLRCGVFGKPITSYNNCIRCSYLD